MNYQELLTEHYGKILLASSGVIALAIKTRLFGLLNGGNGQPFIEEELSHTDNNWLGADASVHNANEND